MKDLTILIVDDDADFREALCLMLQELGYQDLKVAHDFSSGLIAFAEHNPDLVILDIDFGGKENGIDLGTKFREENKWLPIIIMTNNYEDTVYESASLMRPNAFLDKELSELNLRQAIELALDLKAFMFSAVLDEKRIFIKVGSYYKKVEFADIDYLFYENRHSNVSSNGQIYPLRHTMKEIYQLLPESQFIQIHQSYIINIDRINKISLSQNEVEIEGKRFPIGYSYRKKVRMNFSFLR